MAGWTTRLISAAVLAALPAVALAEYPDKPVRFVVPWPPGDLEDVLTRMIAEEFQATYGVPAAVVNRPGAGGGPFPGAVEVAQAEADGHTIGSFVASVPIGGPKLGIAELTPNPFEPLGIFLTYPFVIATLKSAPYQDWAGLAAHAQGNPVALGHFGMALIPTKVTLAAARKAGFAFGSEAAFDSLDCNTLASGDADVITTTLQQIMPCRDQVTLLASLGDARISIAPDTPTMQEIYPDLALSLWNGLFVKTGTPQEARDKITAVARAVIASPEAVRLSETSGALIYWTDAEAAAARIEADSTHIIEIDALLAD